MTDSNSLIKALLNAFPSLESFYDFKENDREIARRVIPVLMKYAFSHAIIDAPTEAAFIRFLEKNTPAQLKASLPPGLTFPVVLDKLAGNLSVNALIAQLEITAKELAFPDIQASMITRLKQRFVVNTPKKRALLRLLAFKLGQKYPETDWHFERLKALPETDDPHMDLPAETAGVTITFHLQSQGDIIAPPDVAWLRHELSECIEYLRLEHAISKRVIEMVGATTFNLKAPKKAGPVDEPRLYSDAVRNVLAIAHQMAARWLLSDYGSPQKKLIIIIHAGAFTEATPTIQRILDMPLGAESGIYLTDFAHLCALFASVKAGFEPRGKSAHPVSGYPGLLWAVSYFLSYSYYDYIPSLLNGDMLPRSVADTAYEDFKRVLHFPEQAGQVSFGAISAMHRFPQSSLLLIEIAKVLYARGMPFEADSVISNLLLSSPQNLVARLMRMQIYAYIAQTQSDLASARLAFERAEAEGEFIVKHCEPESDIWHEIGVLHFRQAMRFRQAQMDKTPTVAGFDEVARHLEKARSAFHKSMTVSATGKALNSLYMFGYTSCFLALLQSNQKLTGKDSSAQDDVAAIFRDISLAVFRNIGWIRNEAPPSQQKLEKTFHNLLLTINLVIARYENLVLCRSNIPFMKFMFAVLLWDFAPAITPQICRITLAWLKLARKEAQKLLADNVSVYHVACGNIGAERFIQHVDDTMDILYEQITDEDLSQEKDTPEVREKLARLAGMKLMLLEISRTQAEGIPLCA